MLPHIAVVQPLPGIGDMIWHLPHIRAIAQHVGAPVTLIAKPRSAAEQLFGGEQTVRDVMWLDRNPERKRGRHDGPLGLWKLIVELRGRRLDAIYLLHHSRMLGFAAMAAGIPARFGYGFRLQRPFLNRGPFLDASVLRLHPHEQATTWLTAAGIPIADTEPSLPIVPAARAEVRRRLGTAAVTPVSIGIASSEPYKQWGAERFAALASGLLAAGWSPLILVGGQAETSLANDIMARLGAQTRHVLPALGWNLTELAALFADSTFYVGNDTGVMNLAAAVGARTYSLFGATPPFHHSRHIVPITPPGGIDMKEGMRRITPEAVLATITADGLAAKPKAMVG